MKTIEYLNYIKWNTQYFKLYKITRIIIIKVKKSSEVKFLKNDFHFYNHFLIFKELIKFVITIIFFMPIEKLIKSLFDDERTISKIKTRLPYLFQIAELESSRAGKIGMEVGSLREKIIIALLIYKFGEENICTDIPITESEIDVKLFNIPVSIKTITGKNPSGVKLIWTVEAKSAINFRKNYYPKYDMIIVNINWNDKGWFYYISVDVQQEVFKKMGNKKYIKLPKSGTNPRGVEMSKDAYTEITNHKFTKCIPIIWTKNKIDYQPYSRWVDLWSKD